MPCSMGQALFSSRLWGRTLSLCLVLLLHPTPSSAAPMGDRIPPSLLHSPLWARDLHSPRVPAHPSGGLGCVFRVCGSTDPACGAEGAAQSRAQQGLEPWTGTALSWRDGAAQRDRGHVPTLPGEGSSEVPPHARLGVPRSPLPWNRTRPLALLGPRQDAAGLFCFKRKPKKAQRRNHPEMGKAAFSELHWAAVLPCPPCTAALAPRGLEPDGKNSPPAVWASGLFVRSVQPLSRPGCTEGTRVGLVTPRAAPVLSDVPAWCLGFAAPLPCTPLAGGLDDILLWHAPRL